MTGRGVTLEGGGKRGRKIKGENTGIDLLFPSVSGESKSSREGQPAGGSGKAKKAAWDKGGCRGDGRRPSDRKLHMRGKKGGLTSTQQKSDKKNLGVQGGREKDAKEWISSTEERKGMSRTGRPMVGTCVVSITLAHAPSLRGRRSWKEKTSVRRDPAS